MTSLRNTCDHDRGILRLEPLRLIGVGVEVSSPVCNDEVMPQLSDRSQPPVRLAAALRRLFDADSSFSRPIPVVVENDVNAWRCWPPTRSTTPSRILWWSVGAFDKGVGSGLVMDGWLRRG